MFLLFFKRKCTWRCPILSIMLLGNSLLFTGPRDFYWWSWTTFGSIWNPPEQNVILHFYVKPDQPGTASLLFNQLQQLHWENKLYTQVAWFMHNFPTHLSLWDYQKYIFNFQLRELNNLYVYFQWYYV